MTDLASLATRKFEFEDIVNADPRCPQAALKVVRAYLRFVTDFDEPVFRSTLDLRIDTALSENTVREARGKLVKLGYLVEAGRTPGGVARYRLSLAANENRVLDHLTIARETLRRMQAEKKEKVRAKAVTSNSEGTETAGTANIERTNRPCTSEFEVTDPFTPLRNCGDSTSESEGDYLEYNLEKVSTEREGLALPPAQEKPTPPPDDPLTAALRRAAELNGGAWR